MIPITCIEETSDPKIKLEERGSKVIFLNEVRHPFRKIKVDGCVVQNQTAADWVVSKPPVGDLVLELKGRNVDHAIEQVTTTLRLWRSNNWCCGGQTAALIVSRQVPKGTLAQKAMKEFRREFGSKIKLVSHNQEFEFADLF